jgi:hypothetical protein
LIRTATGRYKRLMDMRAARELGSHLASDEKLIWAGSPDRLQYALHGVGFTKAGVLLIAVLVGVWWLLVFFGVARLIDLELGAFLVLMLAAPALVVMAALAMRPLRRWSEARNIAYGLTDRRAVILVGGAHSRIEDAAPSRFARPHKRLHGNGSATISFIRAGRLAAKPPRPADDGSEALRGFIAVREADALEAEIERLRKAGSDPVPSDSAGGNLS